MLPFIDRLFGTFYLPRAWPKDYGTSTPVPETMIGQLLEPLADRRGPRPIAGPVLEPGLIARAKHRQGAGQCRASNAD